MSVATKPRILILDIETAPDIAYVWGVYQTNAVEIREHWHLLSYAARWYGQGRAWVRGNDDFGTPTNDRRLLKELHGLLDEADIVVAHNGVDFDLKKITARFIVHGFNPPSPYKIVDTKRAVKQVAGFSSNRLDWLCSQLDIGRKIKHEGFEMWKGCLRGEPKWWAKMKRYNLHDVRLLEELYTRIAPWIKQPNAALYHDGETCVNPACGSTDIHIYPRLYYANTRAYKRMQCRACGKWARATISERRPRATVVQTA